LSGYDIKKNLRDKFKLESGAIQFAAGVRRPVAFVYPNVYKVGMSNLGLQILYKILNSRGDTACERYFLPEKELLQEHIRTNTTLMSVESQRKLADNEIIFVMLSFEMDYDNLLTMLDLGNIKLDKTRRNQKEPLIEEEPVEHVATTEVKKKVQHRLTHGQLANAVKWAEILGKPKALR